ncbi:MAG: sugar phosphate nucleotidyltransferase [Promethearchaeota archaeon]
MKALILAGGIGTRLRPLTCTRPKQLLPLAESTLIGYNIGQLTKSGIREVILATGYNIEQFRSELENGTNPDVTLHFSVESHPLGTAGAIKHAEPYLQDVEQFLVLNGDIVSDIAYNHMLQYHKDHQAMATIALYRVEDPSRYGVVDVTANGQIHQFVEKPPPGQAPSNLINAGCYVLDSAVLNQIPPNRELSIEYEVFPQLCQSTQVYGWEHHGIWIDTGTPASFLEAHQVLRGKIGKTPQIGKDTKIASSAQIASDVTIGNHVTIGNNTKISNAVIFDNAIIDAEVIIHQSIVGQGAIIGKALTLDDYTVIGDGAILDTGAVIPPGSIVCPQCRVKKDAYPPHCFVKNLKSL